MKQHTAEFKQELVKMGKKLDSIITYGSTTLHEELYKVTPLFKANLLKSVMKQLEIESSVDIPLETVVNYQLGVLIGDEYEYLDYGNYVVYSSEKQEDTDTYKIVCYDKMLYAMKPYEEITGNYPMTIKAYLGLLATRIGLTLKNTNFNNYAMTIQTDLYKDLEYTYRDVLDEIAQATGSFIIINENDEIEVKYPSISGDTIDENYLKDVNVNFGEKYGPVNSIVLSRAGESDNVYLRDEQSVTENGLCEIKIVDNQIMNFNDRSDYLQGILTALDGTEYYLNDYSSIGILYFDVGDYYNITVGENTYKCLMLNDEINVENGIQENVYTDMPEQSETDYTKADKTDRRINQTYIIVDKQNQTIESVVSNISEQNEKIAQINQTVDAISAQISDIADITTYGESSFAGVELDDINTSEPIMLKVHPTVNNISYLYPFNLLYPSSSTFMSIRTIRFENTEKYIITRDEKFTGYKQYFSYDLQTEEYTLLVAGTDYNVGDYIPLMRTIYEHDFVDYVLPDDLLIYSQSVYDEFYLDYESQTCQVTKRCKYNADGTVSQLQNEVTTDYDYPLIALDEGDYKVSILGYEYGYIYVRLMAKNIYTDQFYTKSETNSLISQTANDITLSVNRTLTNYSTTNQMNSAIQLKANEITSTVASTYETKSNAISKYSQLQQTDSQIQSTVATKVGNNEVISKINQSSEAVTINANKIGLTANNVLNILSGNTINLTSKNIAISSSNFNVDKNGNVTANNLTATNANISGSITSSNASITGGYLNLSGASYSTPRFVTSGTGLRGYYGTNTIYPDGMRVKVDDDTAINLSVGSNNTGFAGILSVFDASGAMAYISPTGTTSGSLEKYKKNFEKMENALEIIQNIDIYKYNLKSENDNTKKHIGFVIGDNYKYRKEVTSIDNDGAELYSFISVCCKAIQEQQEQIENLKKEIKELKEGK